VPDLITEPGRYDMTADEYFADPVEGGSLSSSGARRLLPPGCPALFDYERHNPPEPKSHFDIGTAAHTVVLGKGQGVTDTGLTDRRGNAWKEAAATCRKQGTIPLLSQDYETIQGMADALRAHELGSLFTGPGRLVEVVLVWRHQLGWDHIWRRAMVDLIPDRTKIVDYKSADKVDLDSLQRAVANYGYHQQADWYLSGAVELGVVDPDAEFWFIAQAKSPPYLVTPFRLDHEALSAARVRNHEAMSVYAECRRTGVWPGHATGVEELSLPRWATRAEVADW
jgi:hypothetical protein